MKQAFKYLQDFHSHLTFFNSPGPIQVVIVNALLGKQFHLSNFISCNKFFLHFQVSSSFVSSHNKPQIYARAIKEPHWLTAIENELKVLESN